MLRSVLIGVDGSEFTNSALELGIRSALRSHAVLMGLGIVDVPAICRPEMVPLGADYYKEKSEEHRLSSARRRVQSFLERFTQRCGEAGVACKGLQAEGDPAEQILAEAQRCDVVLLGRETHFRFATQESADDTLKQVLRNSPRPVVVAPERLRNGESIVVAYDGSVQAARALQAFQSSGLAAERDVHVIAVGSDPVETAHQADRAVEFLRSHAVATTLHVIASRGAIAEALLAQAEILKAELMVMGCYGQSTMREFFLGSVTRTALKESSAPLFLYH